MRLPIEAEITAIVNRVQALVRGLGVVHAIVAAPAGHERWQHDLRAHLERLTHEVLGQIVADLTYDPCQLVAERKRPGEWPGPVALEDVKVGAADPAGRDADERSLAGYVGLRHLAYHGRGPGPSKVATRMVGMSSPPVSKRGSVSTCTPGREP